VTKVWINLGEFSLRAQLRWRDFFFFDLNAVSRIAEQRVQGQLWIFLVTNHEQNGGLAGFFDESVWLLPPSPFFFVTNYEQTDRPRHQIRRMETTEARFNSGTSSGAVSVCGIAARV